MPDPTLIEGLYVCMYVCMLTDRSGLLPGAFVSTLAPTLTSTANLPVESGQSRAGRRYSGIVRGRQ